MIGMAIPCMLYERRLRSVVLLLLSLSMFAISSTAALGQRSMCEVFDMSRARQAPAIVRNYLRVFSDDIVDVCPGIRESDYIASGSVTRQGRYCQYPVYELTTSKTTPSRLERTIRPTSNNFLITDNPCPSRKSGKYIYIEQLPLDVARRLVNVWRDAISSREAFERSMIIRIDNQASHNVVNIIAHGRGSELAALRVLAAGGLTEGWLRSYELDVSDPDHPNDGGYRVTILGLFGIFYHIVKIDQFAY